MINVSMQVYEACKLEPLLGNYAVDWGVCLHAHYPWVNILATNICVMKSYRNDFIACFCSTDEAGEKLESRGFCITKFECLLNNAGVDTSKQGIIDVPTPAKAVDPQLILELIHVAGQVSTDCAGHVQYFVEANNRDAAWFGAQQRKDNLRVRAPYHPQSPCRERQFRGQFDIGQLDVDNIEAGVMVYTPFIESVIDAEKNPLPPQYELYEPAEEVEEETCKPPEVDPEHQKRMDILSFFFEERIMADMAIWIPGIIFSSLLVYSAMLEEQSWKMRFFISLIQGVVISIGIYNTLIAALPLDMLTNIQEFRKIQAGTFTTVFLLTNTFLNYREITDLFLKVAMGCFIPDIVCWKLISMMYTEERMFNFKLIYVSFLMSTALISVYYVRKNLKLIWQSKKLNDANEYQQRTSKKRKNKNVKTMKQESPEGFYASHTRAKKIEKECSNKQASQSIFQIKTVKGSGSLTSSLLDKGTAKVKSRAQKPVRTVARSHSNTSTSSLEDTVPSLKLEFKTKSKPAAVAPERTGCPKDGVTPVVTIPGLLPSHNEIRPSMPKLTTPSLPKLSAACRSPAIKPKIPDNLHDSRLVERLVEQNCPESFDQNCKLHQKSKILTMLRQKSQTEDFQAKPPLNATKPSHEACSGFLISETVSSNSLIFVPGLAVISGEVRDVDILNTSDESPTLDYQPGSKDSSHKEITKDIATDKSEIDSPAIEEDSTLTSPLARILMASSRSLLAGYSSEAVERTIKSVLLDANIENLTIPKFRDILLAKLEQEETWGKGIYVSDDEDSEDPDECHICLAPLESDLEVVEPCGHAFHASCITGWVVRQGVEEMEASCPKCRAVI